MSLPPSWAPTWSLRSEVRASRTRGWMMPRGFLSPINHYIDVVQLCNTKYNGESSSFWFATFLDTIVLHLKVNIYIMKNRWVLEKSLLLLGLALFLSTRKFEACLSRKRLEREETTQVDLFCDTFTGTNCTANNNSLQICSFLFEKCTANEYIEKCTASECIEKCTASECIE